MRLSGSVKRLLNIKFTAELPSRSSQAGDPHRADVSTVGADREAIRLPDVRLLALSRAGKTLVADSHCETCNVGRDDIPEADPDIPYLIGVLTMRRATVEEWESESSRQTVRPPLTS